MQSESEQPKTTSTSTSVSGRWGKRLGAFAFLFFLIKGLLWLVVPAALVYFGWGGEK